MCKIDRAKSGASLVSRVCSPLLFHVDLEPLLLSPVHMPSDSNQAPTRKRTVTFLGFFREDHTTSRLHHPQAKATARETGAGLSSGPPAPIVSSSWRSTEQQPEQGCTEQTCPA